MPLWGLLVEAAGGWDQFLERYAVMVVADHSQSAVERAVDAQEPLEGRSCSAPAATPIRPSATWPWPPATGWPWPTLLPAAG
jgi:hypothetical protein